MAPLTSARTPALKSASAMNPASVIGVRTPAIESVVIGEDSAVGYVSVVVINDIVVMPVRSPVVPSPTESAKIANSKAQPKRNSRAAKVQSGIRIPTWPNPDRLSIRKPGIILRHVNNLRVGGFDDNGLPLIAHVFLRCAL
jgi:hypothetical protein